ncbi:hypothetical protein [Streptococcus suis]|uniref:hypothetical protein n=1 Tax=Streptococcus suis TaxID=1307 RepID=UPI001C9BC67E|nr:hypothetical protein [Streptococcus suis]QZS50407.1 hypothetical protein K6976_06145 [Streptococcus suis]QZT22538.1 hypothetical protein K6975_05260 [Streptococcus suis]HEM3523065.1 hypothetical protein [Streptococcus suis]
MIMIRDIISIEKEFSEEEYFGKYSASFKSSYIENEFNELLRKVFSSISSRDKIHVIVKPNESDEFIRLPSFDKQKILKFIEDCSIESEEVLDIRIEISKYFVDGKLSIYSFDSFQSKICSLPLLDVMQSISDYLQVIENTLIFEVMHDNFYSFSTKHILFMKYGMDSLSGCVVGRKEKLSKVGLLNHFFNISSYTLLPEDFRIEKSVKKTKLIQLFEKISTLLSIIYISYEARINNNSVSIKITDDRIQEFVFDIEQIEYYPAVNDLYKWIVADDNYLDKISVTRNILSINLNDKFIVDTDIIDIIQKTYNVAIKEKIEKFFEVKKETAEFIANTLHELSQIKILIVEKLIYNIGAVGIFLSTTLIPTILETKDLNSIFTSDVRIIIKVSMFGSILYCLLTNIKNYFLYENYKRTLDKLKKNFEEYYSINELNQIFGVKDLNEIKVDILKISIPVSLILMLV